MTHFYQVENKIFFNKTEAIIAANKKKSSVTWHFNEEIYASSHWLIEPSTSLDELYRLRAVEIREKYDYVIVLLSGGADSTNVFDSFVKNGIKLDEVVATAPLSGLNGYRFNDKDQNSSNIISETIYTQLPLLAEISTNYPEIKVSLVDYFKQIIEYDEDQWIINSTDWLHPTGSAKFDLSQLTHLRKLADSGKTIAVVYGIDKPLIFLKDNEIYSVFTDVTVNTIKNPFNQKLPNVDTILFYWSETSPIIPIKQSHVVARWCFNKNNHHLRKLLRGVTNLSSRQTERQRQSKYERTIIPIIYNNNRPTKFQTNKPVNFFMSEIDQWFYDKHFNTRAYQMMQSEREQFLKSICGSYLQENYSYKYFHNLYKIGDIAMFEGK